MFIKYKKMQTVIHHHHHHHHVEGGSLKSVGNKIKNAFSPHHLEHAAISAIPTVTTALGSAVGGLPGAVVGHMAGDMIQQQIPGSGLMKGTKAHIKFHRLKRAAAKRAGDSKKEAYYQKKYDEAIHHYETNPYQFLRDDKEHQTNLRLARKHTNNLMQQTASKPNGSWLAHVKQVYEANKANGMTYKQALKAASNSYR